MICEIVRPQSVEKILYPRNFKEKIPFVSGECEFQPCGWAKIEGEFFPLGYKIVTENLESLGLRKNPNIMIFPVGEWVILPDDQVRADKGDWGGIWTALHKGSIPTLKNYMMNEYQTETRAFLTAMKRPVFLTSYRIKSQGVMLLEEIF